MRRSFFWKLYLSYAALVVVSATVIGGLVLGNLREGALRELRTTLGNNARLVAAMKAANPEQLWSPQMQRQLEEVARDTGIHLLLIFANGRPIAEAPAPGPAGTPTPAPLSLPEFRDARNREFGEDVRPLSPDGAPMLLLATPIVHEYEIIGYVRVGLPLDRLERRRDELRRRVLAGASVNALFALGLGFAVARHFARPLVRIGEACRRIAAGHFDERLPTGRQDEIGLVAATIDRMVGEVRRRIAEETRERQRLGALLAAMADGVVAVSARQTVAYMNEVAARLLGLDPVASVGRPVGSVLRSGAVPEAYRAALESGERVRREVRLTGHPDDVVLHLDATSLLDESGGPFGVLIVLHDLTELRRLENVRQAFSANVSHELKTPLTAIGAVVDALLEDDAMDACTRRRFLRKIRVQNERLARLVHDLLVISRLESDHPLLDLGPVDLAAAVAECAATFVEIARQKQLRFASHLPAAPVVVLGNPEALRLIVNNLLHNAVNYTPEGGAIDLSLTTAGGRATISVRDTGVGISPEHLDRIFERFYRADRARTRNAGGAGLGLSIVKHLAQVMAAQVYVESRPGEGSTFTVQFATIEPAAAPHPGVSP